MNKFISLRIATNGLLIIFSLNIIFHVVVLMGFVPIDMVWGGRLTSQAELVVFEIVSITINVIMLIVVLIYAGIVKNSINRTAIKVVMWIMFLLFVANTIGNINEVSEWERYIFTPITLLLALFSLRLANS
jgi:hypothetical protein